MTQYFQYSDVMHAGTADIHAVVQTYKRARITRWQRAMMHFWQNFAQLLMVQKKYLDIATSAARYMHMKPILKMS